MKACPSLAPLIATVVAGVSLLQPALARANEIDAHTANVPTAAYLHLEPGWYHPTLTRRGAEVGPGFLALDLEAAVHGVPAAEAEARRAVRWSVARLAWVAGATACVGVSLVHHLQHRADPGAPPWPVIGVRGFDLLNLSAAVGYVGAGVAGRQAERAVGRAVNIYDYSLLESVVGQFD
jgi:hypothetical protein